MDEIDKGGSDRPKQESQGADPTSAKSGAGPADGIIPEGLFISPEADDSEIDAGGDGEPHDPPLTRRAKMRQRGIFLLPNLITTGALFAGFYAIVAGMNGDFVPAALAIFVAMALDTADGRVARITNTESEFGAEYDSLSDMVAFGVAPALVAFSWGLKELGQAGWVVTFVYMACAALRLARFNTKGDNSGFTGLASPSAAAILACAIWVWMEYDMGVPSRVSISIMGAITVATGLLMVSNFAYFSPKLINFKGRVPFITLVFVVLALSLMLLDPPLVLLVLFSGYALSGPVQYLVNSRNFAASDASNDVDEAD